MKTKNVETAEVQTDLQNTETQPTDITGDAIDLNDLQNNDEEQIQSDTSENISEVDISQESTSQPEEQTRDDSGEGTSEEFTPQEIIPQPEEQIQSTPEVKEEKVDYIPRIPERVCQNCDKSFVGTETFCPECSK